MRTLLAASVSSATALFLSDHLADFWEGRHATQQGNTEGQKQRMSSHGK